MPTDTDRGAPAVVRRERKRWLGFLAMLLLATAASAQVGMTQLSAGDLPVTLVYPTATTATAQRFGPFELSVALSALPAPGNGRLIVFSHGSGGDASTLHTLARTLALHGFVVAQPEHRGDNWRDQQDAGVVSWQRRPGEVGAAIDAVAADPRFARGLDVERVGVYGLSAGGGTAIALAGGDWSLATLKQHCTAHGRDDAGFCFYGARTEADRSARASMYEARLPTGGEQMLAGPRARDARVVAVAVSVPIGAIFSADSLARIRIPIGVVEAEADVVLNPIYHSAYVLAHCTACRRLDSVAGGGHFDTLSPWPKSVADAAAQTPGSERHPAVDDARRQASYDRIATFFQQQLIR